MTGQQLYARWCVSAPVTITRTDAQGWSGERLSATLAHEPASDAYRVTVFGEDPEFCCLAQSERIEPSPVLASSQDLARVMERALLVAVGRLVGLRTPVHDEDGRA